MCGGKRAAHHIMCGSGCSSKRCNFALIGQLAGMTSGLMTVIGRAVKVGEIPN